MTEKGTQVQNKQESKMERAVLISAVTPDITELQANEYLDELEFLAMTASIDGVKRFLERIDKPHSSTYVGMNTLLDRIDKVWSMAL